MERRRTREYLTDVYTQIKSFIKGDVNSVVVVVREQGKARVNGFKLDKSRSSKIQTGIVIKISRTLMRTM